MKGREGREGSRGEWKIGQKRGKEAREDRREGRWKRSQWSGREELNRARKEGSME